MELVAGGDSEEDQRADVLKLARTAEGRLGRRYCAGQGETRGFETQLEPDLLWADRPRVWVHFSEA